MEQRYKHFFNRAAFGMYPQTAKASRDEGIPNLLKAASGQKDIQVLAGELENIYPAKIKGDREKNKERKANIKASWILLNTGWINQMNEPSLVVREKMTLFWHDHFACRTKNPYLAQQQNNTIRQHALGSFSDLLAAVSKDPAMLQFLNNQQNRKDSPNENFAREVMELFTLGRGEYTEQDIKNAARAFTGWGFNQRTGQFVFRKNVHDPSTKTFRGKTGNFSGDDIISMILEDPATAKFITLKMWHCFVNPKQTVPESIHELSHSFYSSGYNISALLENILKISSERNMTGSRIKSPVELITGIRVHTTGQFKNEANVLFLQKVLGQVLFQPPNVGGWPTDEEWIDSASLALRMSLPALLLNDSETEFDAKDDGDVNSVNYLLDRNRKISFSVDWNNLSNIFMKATAKRTIETIEDYLLAKPASAANRKSIQNFAGKSTQDSEFVKKAFTGFMSLPDYQLN
ncbi:MAG: DUF1800 domain-containing protein [Cyclobacteriaceae bacterium]